MLVTKENLDMIVSQYASDTNYMAQYDEVYGKHPSAEFYKEFKDLEDSLFAFNLQSIMGTELEYSLNELCGLNRRLDQWVADNAKTTDLKIHLIHTTCYVECVRQFMYDPSARVRCEVAEWLVGFNPEYNDHFIKDPSPKVRLAFLKEAIESNLRPDLVINRMVNDTDYDVSILAIANCDYPTTRELMKNKELDPIRRAAVKSHMKLLDYKIEEASKGSYQIK